MLNEVLNEVLNKVLNKKMMGLIMSVLILGACGKVSNTSKLPLNSEPLQPTQSTGCKIHTEGQFVDDFQTSCPESATTKAAMIRYFKGLKSLRNSSDEIERDLITLPSWSHRIESLTPKDTECAKKLLCGE